MAEGLIVEHLDDETLVYDTERNEAHALSGTASAEFLAAEDEVSRREVLRKLALAGAAAAGTAPLVKSIVAPTPAQAASACGAGFPNGCPQGFVCCGGTICTTPLSCCNNAFCISGVCCNNVCCLIGFICVTNVCMVSDRNLKHHLTPVDPQDVFEALGL